MQPKSELRRGFSTPQWTRTHRACSRTKLFSRIPGHLETLGGSNLKSMSVSNSSPAAGSAPTGAASSAGAAALASAIRSKLWASAACVARHLNPAGFLVGRRHGFFAQAFFAMFQSFHATAPELMLVRKRRALKLLRSGALFSDTITTLTNEKY